METTIDIRVFGFTGFYGGIWDQLQNEDDAIMSLIKYGDDENLGSLHTIGDWGFPMNYREQVGKLFATEYIDKINILLGLDIKLIKSYISSPQEYNFSTDKIYATIKIKDYDAMIKRISKKASEPIYCTELANTIRNNHTSRSGFWSWMSNDLEEWLGLIIDPSNEHYVSYIIGYLLKLLDPVWFDEIDNNMYDYVQCNTDLHCIYPITNIAKDEWQLYTQYKEFYVKYANTYPIHYLNNHNWEKYKRRFLAYVTEH